MSRRVWMLTAVLVTCILFIVIASAGATFVPRINQRVLPNIHAGDIHLGGMTREEGIQKLQDLAEKLTRGNITLKYRDKTAELSLAAIDTAVDCDAVMNRALEAGHSGPLWKQWQESKNICSRGMQIPLEVKFDRKKMEQQVGELFGSVLRPPVDASFQITPDDRVEIIPEQNGLRIDYAALGSDLENALAAGILPEHLSLKEVVLPAVRTVEDIKAMGINGLLSSYTTRFDPGQVDRTYNVRVAAAAMDGLLVPPGEEVSFNRVVGPRSTEAGYKNAKIILNNEFVDGLGGGVCQVSSTLYNAVLLAGLNVTERSNHSLPVGYVPIGRDATVVYEYRDFCFQNSHGSYILIKSTTGHNNLTFKIFGNTDNKKNVTIETWITEELEPEVVYEEDPNLNKGQEVVKQKGVRGYKTAGRIIITDNGEKVVKPLPASYYRPQNEVVAIGTKETGTTIEMPGDDNDDPSGSEGPAVDGDNGVHDRSGDYAGENPAGDESAAETTGSGEQDTVPKPGGEEQVEGTTGEQEQENELAAETTGSGEQDTVPESGGEKQMEETTGEQEQGEEPETGGENGAGREIPDRETPSGDRDENNGRENGGAL